MGVQRQVSTFSAFDSLLTYVRLCFRILSTQVNINESNFSKVEKVSSLDLLLEQSDRKITRNQKRKHDEINHVQKVNLLKSNQTLKTSSTCF